MRVRVYPPPFCSFRALDGRGWMELAEGAILSDVVKDALRVHFKHREKGCIIV